MHSGIELNLGDLWKQYGDELVDFARNRLAGISRAGEDAEDVVQNVFLSIHRNPPNEITNARAFLYLAVRRKVVDLIISNRATKAGPIEPDSWILLNLPAADEDFDAMLLICSALSMLCDYERAIAIHRLMYGHTAREVGLLVGLDRNRVAIIAERVAAELRINLAILDHGERLDPQEVARRKRRLLFEAADQIGVAAACRQFGVSTSAYHNWRNEEKAAA